VFTTPDDHHGVHHTRRPSQCSPHQTTITVFTTPDDHHSVHHTRRPSQCSPCQTIITVFTTPDDHHSVHHIQLFDPKLSQMKSINCFTTHSSLSADVLKLTFRIRDAYFSQIILFCSTISFTFIGNHITNNSS